ncbi:MAG: hypothetical protein JW838_15550 [Spirochaetes bacterium]|nr:hypothetical protein [Spirochaetota bacterium]
MKKVVSLFLLVFALAIVFVGCKKEEAPATDAAVTEEAAPAADESAEAK